MSGNISLENIQKKNMIKWIITLCTVAETFQEHKNEKKTFDSKHYNVQNI